MGKKLALKWVSDVIGDKYKEWNSGDIVLINSQTGTGKTYFIINVLLNSLKENETLLYICNRTDLKRQIKKDLLKYYGLMKDELTLFTLDKIKWIENVRVTSYHELQFNRLDELYDGRNNFDLNLPRYVIADECQFLYEDGSFNNKIRFVFDNLVKDPLPFTTKIFISATMEEVKDKIIDDFVKYKSPTSELHIYSTGRDYTYLNPKYFKNIDNIVNLILNDKSDNKWLMFVSNIEKGKDVQVKLGDDISTLVTAMNRKEGNEELENIINNEKFDKKVLITTKVLENGINIKDDLLTNIVVMSFNKIEFLQEIGRKRININDAQEINLYIPTRYKKTFRTLMRTYKTKFDEIKLYNDNPVKFNKKYDNDLKKFKRLNEIFYKDNETNLYEINPIGLKRLELDNAFAEEMIAKFDKDKEFAYIKKQLEWLNLGYTFNESNLIEDVIPDTQLDILRNYLKSIKDKKLFTKEKKELKEIFNKSGLHARTMGINTLNGYLIDTKIKYVIVPKSTKDENRKNIRYWIITDIER